MTSSCGGEGDLLGRGGDAGVGGGLTTFLEFALAFAKIGAIFSSSVGGADDRAEESESDMLCDSTVPVPYTITWKLRCAMLGESASGCAPRALHNAPTQRPCGIPQTYDFTSGNTKRD